MKKINLYIAIALFMNISCYAKNIDIEFARAWYTTDLTKVGTHEISDKSRLDFLRRNREIHKKPKFQHLILPQNKFVNNNLIEDGNFFYILKSDGFIYKIKNETISLQPINKIAINLTLDRSKERFNRFVLVVNNHLLYSTMREKEINCDAFEHYYILYSLNLTTGIKRELLKKMKPYNTLGGCYNQMDILPPKLIKKESWKPIKENTKYTNSDYTLRDDVAYFELRKYVFDKKGEKQLSKKYAPYFSIYRKKLSSFPPKLVNSFKRTPFNNTKPTNIKVEQDYDNYKFKVKGFIIKTDNRFWTMTEEKDFLWLFGKIDTEAELQYFLKVNNLFNNYQYKIDNSYKKTAFGYDVKQEQIKHKIDIKPKGGNYEEHTDYDIYTTYIYHINSNKTFTKEFISKIIKNENKYINDTSIQGDYLIQEPPAIISIPLNKLLSNGEFITP